MKVNVPVNLIDLFENMSEKQVINAIKAAIWSAPNTHGFHAKVLKVLNSEKFKVTLD